MKQVTDFMYYMFNVWCLDEAKELYGEQLGNHIWEKWLYYSETSNDRTMLFFGGLDRECKEKLVNRAEEEYSPIMKAYKKWDKIKGDDCGRLILVEGDGDLSPVYLSFEEDAKRINEIDSYFCVLEYHRIKYVMVNKQRVSECLRGLVKEGVKVALAEQLK